MTLLSFFPKYAHCSSHRIRKNKNRGFSPGNSVQVPNMQSVIRNIAHFHLNVEDTICYFCIGDMHLDLLRQLRS